MLNKPKLQILKRLATKVGATVEAGVQGFHWKCFVDLPAGKVIFGAHGNYMSDLANDYAGRQKSIEALIEWIQETIEDGCECSDPEDCDHCNEEIDQQEINHYQGILVT